MEPWLENFARANFQRSVDTAHDLKTPLNVAVLNLELLRMRLRKVAGEDDEKLADSMRAIDTELRRMGRIFDAFFLLSTPPKNDEQPETVDAGAICSREAESHGFALDVGEPALVLAHEARIRQACRLFFEGASKLLRDAERSATVSSDAGCYAVTITGRPREDELELTKVFKFYYTDPEGNPDLALAVARLIAETYGGELAAADDRDRDNVILRLSFPLGAK
jgi:nitrogen fixation/metabolism regulation signal transduction histidine kinase